MYWKPNGGCWMNTGPCGLGELYNSDTNTAYKGNFVGALLDDTNGTMIVYNSNCFVYTGNFVKGVMDGDIDVIEIAQTDWEEATSGVSSQTVSCTKKKVKYQDGAVASESNSTNEHVTIQYIKDDDHCFISADVDLVK